MSDNIKIELSADEALVLFEYLSRFSDTGKTEFEDKSKKIALWNLTCLLEKVMVEPFKPNYGELVHAARVRLRGEDDASYNRLEFALARPTRKGDAPLLAAQPER